MKRFVQSIFQKLKYYVLASFVLINVFIAGQSLTPGGESAEQSNFVAGIFATIASWVIPVETTIIPVTGITIQGPNTIHVGEAGLMTAVITPNNATNTNIVWRSSDASIVEITSGGRLIPKALGTVTLTAQSSVIDVFAEHLLSVIPLPFVTSFSASLPEATIDVGSSETILISDVVPVKSDRSNIVFSSLNESIAFVSEQGVITGIGEGTTKITVGFINQILFEFDITVVTSNNIIPTAMTITNASGEEGPFESYIYSYYPLSISWGDTIPTHTTVTWSSSDPNIAKVDENGQVYGFKFEGDAYITATSHSNPMLTTTIPITMVKALPSALTLTPANNRVEVSAGSRLRINYVLTPFIEGTIVYDQQLVWSSSNTTIAEITSSGDYGTLVAKQPGNVTITAVSVMDDNVQASISIQVLRPNLLTEQDYVAFATFFRKAVGHFLLFGLNGIFGYWTFYLWLDPKKQTWYVGVSLGLGLVASITSELLQAITPQRTSTILDMMLNFTGYLSLTLLLWAVVTIYFPQLKPLHQQATRNRIKKSI